MLMGKKQRAAGSKSDVRITYNESLAAEAYGAEASCRSTFTPLGTCMVKTHLSLSHDPTLKGVLPKDYAHPRLDKQRLGELIDIVQAEPYQPLYVRRAERNPDAPEIEDEPWCPRPLRDAILEFSGIDYANYPDAESLTRIMREKGKHPQPDSTCLAA